MNEESWHKIMKESIKSYEAIIHLIDKGVLSEDDAPHSLRNYWKTSS